MATLFSSDYWKAPSVNDAEAVWRAALAVSGRNLGNTTIGLTPQQIETAKKYGVQPLIAPRAPLSPYGAPAPEPAPFTRNVLYPETAGPATALAKAAPTLDFSKMMDELSTGYKAASDTALKAYDTAGLENEVPGLQKSYETGQGDVLTKFGESNARYAQETKDSIARLTAQLDQTEANIRSQANAAASLGASVARFPGVGGSDTITANNAGLAGRIARAGLIPLLAAEERIGNQRYGQIANIEMPLDRELYGNDQGLLSFTAALNDKFRGDRFQIASFLNDVKTRMAQMPLQLQESYANYVLKLIGGEQTIAAGQLSNLTAAQRLIAASEFLERNIPEPALQSLNQYPVNTPNMAPLNSQPQLTEQDIIRLLGRMRGGDVQVQSPITTASPAVQPLAYPAGNPYPGSPSYVPGFDTGGYPVSINPDYVEPQYFS